MDLLHGSGLRLLMLAISNNSAIIYCAKPSEVLDRLNDIFSEYYKSLKMYITGIVVDINTENNFIMYASAGHPDQIMVKNGNIHELSRTGPAIGISRTPGYDDRTIGFNHKDTFFLGGIFHPDKIVIPKKRDYDLFFWRNYR